MLPSASALASRREERVQKAFSVDHHGPGDARLSHRATAIYGEHSDYVAVLAPALAQARDCFTGIEVVGLGSQRKSART